MELSFGPVRYETAPADLSARNDALGLSRMLPPPAGCGAENLSHPSFPHYAERKLQFFFCTDKPVAYEIIKYFTSVRY